MTHPCEGCGEECEILYMDDEGYCEDCAEERRVDRLAHQADMVCDESREPDDHAA